MSSGVWEPSGPLKIGPEKLRQLVEIAARVVDAENLSECLPPGFIKDDRQLMKQPAETWALAEALTDDELISLIRFFTLAEMQLTGWDAGKLSPVIYLVKILKNRSGLDPELRRWIKANTDNRYLPNGAAL